MFYMLVYAILCYLSHTLQFSLLQNIATFSLLFLKQMIEWIESNVTLRGVCM